MHSIGILWSPVGGFTFTLYCVRTVHYALHCVQCTLFNFSTLVKYRTDFRTLVKYEADVKCMKAVHSTQNSSGRTSGYFTGKLFSEFIICPSPIISKEYIKFTGFFGNFSQMAEAPLRTLSSRPEGPQPRSLYIFAEHFVTRHIDWLFDDNDCYNFEFFDN